MTMALSTILSADSVKRLACLRRLRELETPRWVIKFEQAQLAKNRKFPRSCDASDIYLGELFERYVEPLMGGDHV
jgi:hypothetical protein